MNIRVRLFAQMTAAAGAGEVLLEVPAGARAGSVRELLAARFKGLKWPAGTMLALNQEYAGPEALLHEGDEVAIIPPVSGG